MDDLVSVKFVYLLYDFNPHSFQILSCPRCFELVKVKKKDLVLNEENQRAYNLPYHSLHLLDRKGWQKKLSKTEREADLKSVLSIQIFSNHH